MLNNPKYFYYMKIKTRLQSAACHTMRSPRSYVLVRENRARYSLAMWNVVSVLYSACFQYNPRYSRDAGQCDTMRLTHWTALHGMRNHTRGGGEADLCQHPV